MRYRGVEERLKRSDREVEEKNDKDNMLESKMTQNYYLSLLTIKRLESYILFRENP